MLGAGTPTSAFVKRSGDSRHTWAPARRELEPCAIICHPHGPGGPSSPSRSVKVLIFTPRVSTDLMTRSKHSVDGMCSCTFIHPAPARGPAADGTVRARRGQRRARRTPSALNVDAGSPRAPGLGSGAAVTGCSPCAFDGETHRTRTYSERLPCHFQRSCRAVVGIGVPRASCHSSRTFLEAYRTKPRDPEVDSCKSCPKSTVSFWLGPDCRTGPRCALTSVVGLL